MQSIPRGRPPRHLPFALLAATLSSCQTTTPRAETRTHTPPTATESMHGYSFGSTELPRSPIHLEDLARLRQALLLEDDDLAALRMSLPVLEPQVDDVLDVWYGFVGSTPHLVHYFSDARTGEPDADYLAAVRKRFGQWILDTARAQYDQRWLDWQHEIGLRHHSTKKNRTDGGRLGADHSLPLPAGAGLSDHGNTEAVPGQGRPLARGRRAHAPGVDQGGAAPVHSLELPLRPRR